MQLLHATWPEVEACLSHTPSIVIPTGSTEQHGPTGLIGTDAICAQSISVRASEQTDHMLVGPTLSLTPAQFNLAFPGTISIRASTFIAMIEDIVTSLARSGFVNFYFLNGHGGNIGPLRAAMHDLHQANSLNTADTSRRLRFRLRSWWDFEQTNTLRQSLYAEREGMHATPSEISITRHALPQVSVTDAALEFKPLASSYFTNHAHDSHDDAMQHRKSFPDGRVGSDPSDSCAAHGDELLALAARELCADWQQFIEQAD